MDKCTSTIAIKHGFWLHMVFHLLMTLPVFQTIWFSVLWWLVYNELEWILSGCGWNLLWHGLNYSPVSWLEWVRKIMKSFSQGSWFVGWELNWDLLNMMQECKQLGRDVQYTHCVNLSYLTGLWHMKLDSPFSGTRFTQ